MRNLAIIPARSGSKGVRDKNIRDLCGKPLMAYTIEAAIGSRMFDEVMVSTDSEKYAEVAGKYGAKVPFLRSDETSGDQASSWDTVEEVLRNYSAQGKEFESFCLLQPTSPLRSADDICGAYHLYQDKAKFAVVSVCKAEHSPLWCGHLPADQSLNGFLKEDCIGQRQSHGPFYRLNGAIYIVDTARFKSDRFLYQEGSFAYLMEPLNSIDIDTELDFMMAEFLMRKKAGLAGIQG